MTAMLGLLGKRGPTTPRARPAPAALTLGVLTGLMAMLLVLPTALPLTLRLAAAEEALAVREAQRAAFMVASMVVAGETVAPNTMAHLDLDYLEIQGPDGRVTSQEGVALPEEVRAAACGPADLSQVIRDGSGTHWAVACLSANDARVITAFRPSLGVPGEVTLVVIALAVVVGIVSALGVLRILSPLSRISVALDRVGAGERGVRVASSTGLSELDDLIARVNSAAQAMEDREDEILSRVKVVQEMARMVAHEVRNPLQSMELLTSLIVNEDVEQEREDLAMSIHQEIRTLDMVVTRLLNEGTTTSGLRLQTRPGTLAPLIRQVITLRTPEARKQGITLDLGPIDNIELSIDHALLGRSIENLILNAMQAVPPTDGRVRISAVGDGSNLVLTVEDNGHGVPEAFGDDIYTANVSGRTGGTGLGLALTKAVIVAHGGTIVHDRSPLGGARFTARLPLTEVAVAV